MKMKAMKSGNLLKYEVVQYGSKGGIRAVFTSAPSDDDVKEGQAFLEALVPDRAAPSMKLQMQATEAEAKAVFDEHLGVSRN